MRKLPKPLLFLPGLVFWGLVGTGIATDNDALIGTGVVLFGIVAVAVITWKLRVVAAARGEKRRIWLDGQPGRASVIAISSTGGGINDHPMIDLELDVSLDGATPYRVSVQALISLLAIPRIQPRCEIAVQVDRADRSRVVVDSALTPYGYR